MGPKNSWELIESESDADVPPPLPKRPRGRPRKPDDAVVLAEPEVHMPVWARGFRIFVGTGFGFCQSAVCFPTGRVVGAECNVMQYSVDQQIDGAFLIIFELMFLDPLCRIIV
jgi:hypothetical protein